MVKRPDPEFDALERDLKRRTERLGTYLKVRAVFGLLLMGLGLVGFGGALVIVLVAVGTLDIPSIAQWTGDFGAVMAPFMPAAFGFISFRAGLAWWRARRPEDPDTGCLVA